MAVLITGASSGLGKEFAYIFAEHGFDVALVARRKEILEQITKDIETKYNVSTTIICEDLSKEDAAKNIYDTTKELGIEIEQLVNNAGSGHMASVAECDPKIMKDIITLNITSLTLLSHYYAKDMTQKGFGKILFVSSIFAFQPDPYFNVYGPSKAYEYYLGTAMYEELKDTGITISILCPGSIKTNWARNAGRKDAKHASDPKRIATIGFQGMQKGKLVIVPTIPCKVDKILATILPTKTMSTIVGKWQKRLTVSTIKK